MAIGMMDRRGTNTKRTGFKRQMSGRAKLDLICVCLLNVEMMSRCTKIGQTYNLHAK
jgi:hypothetical protein